MAHPEGAEEQASGVEALGRSALVVTAERPAPRRPSPRSHLPNLAIDVLILLALFALAVGVRFRASHGDLWLDEADYAFAASHGIDANRWDRSYSPSEPDKMVVLRHFHPPLVSIMDALALRYGADERALRVLPVLFGGLSVCLVYLCGLALFGGSRGIAAACAGVVVVTAAHVRMSSHALPWSYIIFWLLLGLLALLWYTRTQRPGWLVALGLAFGGMFGTSEVIFPMVAAIAAAGGFVLWRLVRTPRSARGRAFIPLALGVLGGVAAFLVVGYALYPEGFRGGITKMLRHYVAMSHDAFPTNIGSRVYDHAPKWAYLYWYWHFFRAYFLFYALGIPAVLLMAGRALWQRRESGRTGEQENRRTGDLNTRTPEHLNTEQANRRTGERASGGLTAEHGVLIAYTGVILLSAHAAHILGPEYLAHALPFLTLFGGLFFYALEQFSRPAGLAAAWLACLYCVIRPGAMTLPGMDARSQIPRWAQAGKALAVRWQPGDQMLAPAYGVVGRWYVLNVGHAPAKDWQVEALPGDGARPALLRDLQSGAYRFVAVGSTFSDTPSIDPKVWRIVRSWPAIWRSDECGTGPSRLVIYQLPARRK